MMISSQERSAQKRKASQFFFYKILLKNPFSSQRSIDSYADSLKTKDDNPKIYPRDLEITWGKDQRYWKLPRPNTREEESFAELKQVCWLEVTGSTKEDVIPGKSYNVGFQVSLTPDAFGWEDCNVYIMAKIGKKGIFSFKQESLAGRPAKEEFTIPTNKLIIKVPNPKDRPESQTSDDQKLYFGLYDVWTNRWKGGLKIHYAFIEMVNDSTNQNEQQSK